MYKNDQYHDADSGDRKNLIYTPINKMGVTVSDPWRNKRPNQKRTLKLTSKLKYFV